jgi:hypothetical protein
VSARKHIADALREATALVVQVGTLGTDLSRGQRVTPEALEHLLKASRFIAAQLAIAHGDLERIPQIDEPVRFVESRDTLPHGQTNVLGRRIDDPPITLRLRDVNRSAA